MVGPLAPHLDVKIEVTSGLQIKWRAGPSHMIMICWFLRFKICDIDLFPTICKFLQLVAPNPIWLLYNYICCICHTVFFWITLSPQPRLALLLYLVAAMAGTWMVEQPSLSMLRFHPRVMEVFSDLREPWLHDVASDPTKQLELVGIVNFWVITITNFTATNKYLSF